MARRLLVWALRALSRIAGRNPASPGRDEENHNNGERAVMHRKHLVAAACRCGRQKEGGQLIPLPPAMIENQAAESSTEVSGESFSSAGSVLQLDGITPIEQNHSALHMIATHQLCFECTKSMHDNIKSQPTDSRFGGDTTCHYAARAGNLTTLCHLITLEGRYGYGEMKKVLEKQNERGETILHEAVRRADRNMVEYLMYYQTDLASILSDGTSPLYLAVSLGYHDIAEMIYNGSQQLSYSGPNGQNALHASVLRSEEMTNKLLKWQKELAEQKDQHGSTPLHLAVSVEDRSSIKICWFPFYRPLEVPIHELLEASKSPAFEPDQSGSFPIHIAASMGVQKAISVLLKKCPDCAGLRDAKGKTFLHVAVERKRLNVVKFACRNTDLSWILNMQDSDGNTALHLVIQAGDLGIFGCLMGNQQVCLNLANNSGLTPLDLAESKIPPQFSIQWTALNLIHETIKCAKAKHGNIRRDLLKKKHSCQRDVENESERLTKLAQIVIIGSVLIATVTFAAAFTLPGGFRQDDHANGGTPILAGSYTLHAFIIANTIAFVYSSLATFSLIYSAMPFVDLSIRRAYFRSSVGVVACSLRTLAVSFVLAVYTVIAPVDHITALVVCLSASVVISFGHLNIVQTLGLAWALHGRMGFRLSGMLLLRVMMQLALAYWSYPLIFGLPAYLRSHRIGQHQP